MSIFSACLSDAELAHSTDTFGCELGRRLEEAKADLAASRALVDRSQKALGHAVHLTEHNKGMCVRCREARGKINQALALKEADILERLEVK